MKKRNRRTKDKGVTQSSIAELLSRWKTIPDLKEAFRRLHMPMDVTIETAIKNMIADGYIEVDPVKYSCYDAKRYRFKDIPF